MIKYIIVGAICFGAGAAAMFLLIAHGMIKRGHRDGEEY